MEAGRLIHRITIQSVTQGVDAYGGVTETFSDFVTVMADIRFITGREYFMANQVNSNAEYKMNTHWYAGINNKMKVKFGTRKFDILSVYNVDEMNRELIIVCKEYF